MNEAPRSGKPFLETDMAPAQGARAQMALAFETVYGTASTSGCSEPSVVLANGTRV